MLILKKYFLILFLLLINSTALLAQSVGVNTKAPLKELHIKASASDDPLRLEGVKSGTGLYLVVDDNGVVKTTDALGSFVFVLPSVSNTTGLNLTTNSGAGIYAENSVPASGIWTKIPGMQSTFNIIKPLNSLNISAEGMAQYDVVTTTSMSIVYALGIFLDGKLIAVRTFNLKGDGFSGTFGKWDILGQSTNLSVGSHTIELYASRRSSANVLGAIYIAQPAAINNALNQFMAKAVLQVIGIYN